MTYFDVTTILAGLAGVLMISIITALVVSMVVAWDW